MPSSTPGWRRDDPAKPRLQARPGARLSAKSASQSAIADRGHGQFSSAPGQQVGRPAGAASRGGLCWSSGGRTVLGGRCLSRRRRRRRRSCAAQPRPAILASPCRGAARAALSSSAAQQRRQRQGPCRTGTALARGPWVMGAPCWWRALCAASPMWQTGWSTSAGCRQAHGQGEAQQAALLLLLLLLLPATPAARRAHALTAATAARRRATRACSCLGPRRAVRRRAPPSSRPCWPPSGTREMRSPPSSGSSAGAAA